MRYLVVLSMLLVSSCSYTTGPGDRITPEQRLLIVCEGWKTVFREIDKRDQFGLATDAEVTAIENALPVIQPFCIGTYDQAPDASLVTLERLLLEIYQAKAQGAS